MDHVTSSVFQQIGQTSTMGEWQVVVGAKGSPKEKPEKATSWVLELGECKNRCWDFPHWFSGVQSSFLGIISRKTTNKWFSGDHYQKGKATTVFQSIIFQGSRCKLAVGWFLFLGNNHQRTDGQLVDFIGTIPRTYLRGGYVRHAFRFHVKLSGGTLPNIIIMEVMSLV